MDPGHEDEGVRRRGRPPKAAAVPPHPGLPLENPMSGLPPAARHILETARRLLVEKGFTAVTIENVALEAGESPATVKRLFASKAGLVEALLDSLVHDAYVAHTQRVEELPPGEERVHAYITGLLDITRDTAASLGIFEIAPHALRDPLLRSRVAALYAWYRELTLRESGLEAAGAGDDRRPAALAAVLLATLDGLAFQSALDPEGFDTAAALETLDEMVRAAAKPPPAPDR